MATEQFHAIGRRKTSVARVYLRPGNGQWEVNGRSIEQHLPRSVLRQSAVRPLELTENADKFDVKVTVQGGGLRGQADAIRLGLARALVKINEEFRARLRAEELLTRDPREVERKKYGHHKARTRPQYSKR